VDQTPLRKNARSLQSTLIELAGWIGTALILVAYVLSSLGYLHTATISYQLMNLLGALGVGLITYLRRAFQGFVLNLVWAVVALIGLARLMWTG
jgi:predicted ferric reductase